MLRFKASRCLYAVEVTNTVHPGPNELKVSVVNTWVSRLVGDAALPPDRRLTWTTNNPDRTTDPLQPTGLLGPVRLHVGDVRAR